MAKSALQHALRLVASASLVVVLAACKTFSPDAGMDLVAAVADRELRKDVVAVRREDDAFAARARVEGLLARPLTADAAVQIALLNNRALQAAYNELAIAEARMVGASLPPNPTVFLARLSGSLESEIERAIAANILALATLPVRTAIAGDRFYQAQLQAGVETLRVATATRRAYYRAVAAREVAGFLAHAQSAAETAAQLARRLGETGALNKLDQAREQVFYADLTTQLAAARQRAESERERLTRLLGLWGRDLAFRLPDALPRLPRHTERLLAVEIEAIRRRIDLQIARIEVDALAKSYGLSNATRFINLLEAAGVSKTKREAGNDPIRKRGLDVEFQIPLFDFGEVRVREAEASYLWAVNRLTDMAVQVRSQARDAYRVYRSSHDIAGHYLREVLPLRKIISEETQLRYGAMQIDEFALLAEARQRIAATINAIGAARDFWLAQVDLLAAVVGGGADAERDDPGPMAAAEGGARGH